MNRLTIFMPVLIAFWLGFVTGGDLINPNNTKPEYCKLGPGSKLYEPCSCNSAEYCKREYTEDK